MISAWHTKKHLHSTTIVLNHVRSWPVYVAEWIVQEVSLQGKKTKPFYLEVRLPVLSTPERKQVMTWHGLRQLLCSGGVLVCLELELAMLSVMPNSSYWMLWFWNWIVKLLSRRTLYLCVYGLHPEIFWWATMPKMCKNLDRQPYHTCPQPVDSEAYFTDRSARDILKYLLIWLIYISEQWNMLHSQNDKWRSKKNELITGVLFFVWWWSRWTW